MTDLHSNVKNTSSVKIAAAFIEFVNVVATLRDPEGGCPWDLEQTNRSLRKYMVEEAFEAAEAMAGESQEELVGELGDVLLQVVLNSQILSESGRQSIVDVIESISAKMRRRHPHVFGDEAGEVSVAEVKDNWQKIKAEEKAAASRQVESEGSVFAHLTTKPYSTLLQAEEIGKLSKTVAFDWSTPLEVLAKVEEELNELRAEISAPEPAAAKISEEYGDLLFSAVQLGRHLKINSELALFEANQKFIGRFVAMEKLVDNFGELSVAEKEKLWTQVKKQES